MAVAALSVSISARVSKFIKGMKRARKAVAQFAVAVADMAKRVATFSAVLATAAVAGLALLTKSALKSIDAISKMSDRLEISTESLAGFQHVAEITGVSTETMNKAIEQFVRRMGEAKTGIGETKDALKDMGISVDALGKLDMEDQMKFMLKRISEIPDVASRADSAYRMWGRSGLKLVNVALLGADGLNNLMQEAKKLGLTFTRFAGAQVENANDAMQRLSEVTQGLGRAIAIQLSPFIKAAADRLVEMGTAGGGMGEKVTKAFENVTLAIAKMVEMLRKAQAGFLALKGTALASLAGMVEPLRPKGGLQQLFDVMDIFGIRKKIREVVGIRPPVDLDKLFTDLVERSDAAFTEAGEILASSKPSTKVLDFFKGIKEMADRAAQASLDAIKRDGNLPLDFTTRRKKKAAVAVTPADRFATGIEVNLLRKSIGMFTRPKGQKVHDPTNDKILDEMKVQTGLLREDRTAVLAF